MKPELQAYRYYKKNFTFLFDTYVGHTPFGDDSGFNALNKHIAEKFGISEDSFINICALAYDKEGERFSRSFK